MNESVLQLFESWLRETGETFSDIVYWSWGQDDGGGVGDPPFLPEYVQWLIDAQHATTIALSSYKYSYCWRQGVHSIDIQPFSTAQPPDPVNDG